MLQKSLKVNRRVWLFYNLRLRREFRLSDKVYHFAEFHRRCFVPSESCKSYLERDYKRCSIPERECNAPRTRHFSVATALKAHHEYNRD